MSTYSIGFNNGQVEITGVNITVTIPLTELLMNDGTNAINAGAFEHDQSVLNYYDCIKDGTNPATLQQLGIYPNAGKGGYPAYTGLADVEYKILASRKYNLTRTAWLKLKKGHQLVPPKQYNEIMWESGLGKDVFIEQPVKVIKTFGSFIDPLSKTAGEVWPPPQDTLRIQDSFMKLMGFGPSSIVAKANDGDDHYSYKMTIGCGQGCPCVLNNTSSPVTKYTLGNNKKKTVLNASGNPDEKVKYIIVKEWGDKVQVIIYIMYFKISEAIAVAMLTCDMVVFITCLVFASTCIYTGAFSGERLKLLTEDLSDAQKYILNEQKAKRHYSIVEYIPGSKFEQALNEMKMKIDKIIRQNDFFIVSIQGLVQHPETSIQIGGQEYVFKQEFYESCFHDITNIQGEAEHIGNELLRKWTEFFRVEENKTDQQLEVLYKVLKAFESQHLLVPFIKIKKGTKNKLTLLGTKSYIANIPAQNQKPSFTNSIESFQIIAIKHFRDTSFTGEMRGGQPLLGEQQINFNTFVADDDDYAAYLYTFDVSDEFNLVFENSNSDTGIHPDRKMECIENDDNNIKEKNLLTELNSNFLTTINKYDADFKSYLQDTIYTLFVYNSYLTGAGIVHFDEQTLDILIKAYNLEDTLKKIQETFVKQTPSSPRGPSSSDGYFALSPHHNDDDDDMMEIGTGNTSNRKRSRSRGGKKRKTRRLIKKRKYKKTRNAKETKRNKTIKKQRKSKHRRSKNRK